MEQNKSRDPLPADFDPDAAAQPNGIFGLPTDPADAALVLLPVPWEATASYRCGTSQGPPAIVAASSQVELFDAQTGHPYRQGIALLEAAPDVDRWREQAAGLELPPDAARLDQISAELHRATAEQVARWHEQGKLVGIIGGEHGVSLGALRSVGDRGVDFGLLQIDAHADLRGQYEGCRYSHACFAANALADVPRLVRLVQVGIRDYCFAEAERMESDPRVVTYFDQPLSRERADAIAGALPASVWISVDIDGLDPALCPNTGTPVPGGITWREILLLLERVVAAGRRIVGFDLSEVAPDPAARPVGEGIDEIVAARLLYKLCGFTLQSQEE